MATSQQVTQNGNTSLVWTVSGGGMTNHEVFACQLNTTSPNNNTGALINDVTVFINPIRYNCRVTVEGPQAIEFQFNSNGV
jgi:hypothetical protein